MFSNVPIFSGADAPVPLVLLALAVVWLLGVEAWRRASARARAALAEVASVEAALEAARDENWELAEREERYRDLVKAQGDVVIRKDLAGRVTYVNDVFCDIFGKERGQVIGTPFAPELPEGETPRLLGSFAGIALPPHRVRFDQRVLTMRGPRWFVWEEFAIRDGDAKLREVQIVGRDITDRKSVEEKLAETLDEAHAANRAKGQFLAAMSHEIRTPMNGVLGMTSLLLDTKLTPAQRSYAEAVKQSGEALLAIINDILDYSKIEAGRIDIAETPVDLRGILESVCELMSPRAFEKGLEIIAEVEPQVPLRLKGDETRIRQVLLNLVGNAIKFTEKGGVTLGARLESYSYTDDVATVLIEVEDTGIGIDAEAVEVIFDEFAQADQSHARRYEGTGLGLAISRHLVTAMGGTIEVESERGHGSLFRVRLPLAAVEPALPRREILKGLRVIILEDRPVLAASLARTARFGGADIRLVPTVELLIETIQQSPADILICPIDTAEGPGAEIVARARAFAPGIDAIVLLRPQDRDRLPSLLGQDGNPTMFPRLFDGYLVRPVRASSLIARLEALMSNAGAVRSGYSEEAGEETASPETTRWQTGLNVLVVEDNEINALLSRTLLERDGHNVFHARDGAEALDVLESADAIDVVLMDLHMPGMDGFEATRRIRALADARSSVPVIALTANAMSDDRKTCLSAGMDDYLSKPIAPDALARMLAHWAGRRSELGLAPADAKRANLA